MCLSCLPVLPLACFRTVLEFVAVGTNERRPCAQPYASSSPALLCRYMIMMICFLVFFLALVVGISFVFFFMCNSSQC
jgi:hypothetical protein